MDTPLPTETIRQAVFLPGVCGAKGELLWRFRDVLQSLFGV